MSNNIALNNKGRMYVGIHGVPAGWIDPRNLSSPPALVQPQIPKVKMFLVTLVAPHVILVGHWVGGS